MTFHFGMQKVLEYREQLEEQAKVHLASAQSRLLTAKQKEDTLREEISRAQNKLSQISMVQQSEHWLQEQYLKGLNIDLSAAVLQTRMAEQLVEEARKLLAARSMDKKLLEKLKERQKKYFEREESLKEQRFNDEIATLRHKVPPI